MFYIERTHGPRVPIRLSQWECVTLSSTSQCNRRRLITENVLGGEALNRTYLLKQRHIEVLFVAENGVTERFLSDVPVGKVDDILQGQPRQCGIYVLHIVVIEAQLPERQVALNDTELRRSAALD